MTTRDSDTYMLEPQAKISRESTGFITRDEDDVTGLDRGRRPLSMAWISDELLAKTVDVWSANYGRPISDDEAVEILMNVKRMAEVLLETRKEVYKT